MYSAISLRTPSLPLRTAAFHQMQPLALLDMEASALHYFQDEVYHLTKRKWYLSSAGGAPPMKDVMLYIEYVPVPGQIMYQRHKQDRDWLTLSQYRLLGRLRSSSGTAWRVQWHPQGTALPPWDGPAASGTSPVTSPAHQHSFQMSCSNASDRPLLWLLAKKRIRWPCCSMRALARLIQHPLQ